MGATLDRSLGALRTVRASGAEERETARLHGAAERAYEFGMRAAGAQALIWVLLSLCRSRSRSWPCSVSAERVWRRAPWTSPI